MCTALTLKTKDTYFGSNFDWTTSYGEKALFMPKNFPLNFRNGEVLDEHYSIFGIGL